MIEKIKKNKKILILIGLIIIIEISGHGIFASLLRFISKDEKRLHSLILIIYN